MSEWTDELKAEVVEQYTAADPTPENTMDIVAQIAEDYEKTVNGVRMILTKAGVYVKKTPAKSESKSKEGTSKRVNKAEAIEELKTVITDNGAEVEEDILSRMTGKAAVYFAGVITLVAQD
jgi:transposase-like protein